MDAVHRYEGTVNQVMGDGIMALFGAPLAHEDHAVRACYAALRDAGRGQALRRGGPPQRTACTSRSGSGLNTGEVVVRPSARPAHGLHGDGPDDAPGRADGAARAPGTILLTAEHAASWWRATSQVKPLGPVPVKGLSEPVEVFELSGPARRARASRRPRRAG